LGRAAIRQGLSVVYYYRTHLLLEDIAIARIDGSIRKARHSLRKLHLLILDEFGLHDLDDQGKEDMLDIFEDRAGSASTIVIGQRAIAEWHAFLAHPLLADALLDRILCRSYNIELKGRSMRERTPVGQ
jgi:DNA replication protein DnaC